MTNDLHNEIIVFLVLFTNVLIVLIHGTQNCDICIMWLYLHEMWNRDLITCEVKDEMQQLSLCVTSDNDSEEGIEYGFLFPNNIDMVRISFCLIWILKIKNQIYITTINGIKYI